jgi:alpha-galactosidase
MNIAKEHYSLQEYAGPGHWNDPDMLVVGKVGWNEPLHDSLLTPNQQYSHISLWCLVSAPLILGCDLTRMDDFTLGLLTNDEVLAIDQDPLGRQARRVIQEDRFEVWIKELADGSHAVGILNTAPTKLDETAHRDFTLTWESIGLEGPMSVRDLWRQKDLGILENEYKVSLAEYGVSLVKIASASRSPN